MPTEIFGHPFTWGFALGLIPAAVLLFRWWGAVSELRRMRKHLHDRMEIESEALAGLKRERDALKKENENLRLKISSQNQIPGYRIERDLEIFARAEKRMLVGVPGFAPAWENAKAESARELEAEEHGRSLPQRVFTRLFGAGPQKALTAEGAE